MTPFSRCEAEAEDAGFRSRKRGKVCNLNLTNKTNAVNFQFNLGKG